MSDPLLVQPQTVPVCNESSCRIKRNAPRRSLTNAELKRKIKLLQWQVSRSKKRIQNLSNTVKQLKKESLLNAEAAAILKANFSEVAKELFRSEMKNHDRKNVGRRYSEEVKLFALTLNFYSPRAYECTCEALSIYQHPEHCPTGPLRLIVSLVFSSMYSLNYRRSQKSTLFTRMPR